jgi:hypothetical protein
VFKPIPYTVVYLKTKEEYDEYMQICTDAGCRWNNRVPPKDRSYYSQDICVNISVLLSYGRKSYYQDNGYRIITLSELKDIFMKNDVKTFKVGDTVVLTENYKNAKEVDNGSAGNTAANFLLKPDTVYEVVRIMTFGSLKLKGEEDVFNPNQFELYVKWTPKNGELVYAYDLLDVKKNSVKVFIGMLGDKFVCYNDKIGTFTRWTHVSPIGKVNTIIINGKTIALSEESYNALKLSLNA